MNAVAVAEIGNKVTKPWRESRAKQYGLFLREVGASFSSAFPSKQTALKNHRTVRGMHACKTVGQKQIQVFKTLIIIPLYPSLLIHCVG